MNKRINFIDVAKAIAIILIVLGHTLVHSANCGIIFKFLYSFHVVLFFILSGYTFKIKDNESFLYFFKKKFIRIMIPYFIWALLFLVPYTLFGENVGTNLGTNSSFDLLVQIKNVFYGTGVDSALKQNSSLWFLPALFTIEVIYYGIMLLLEKRSRIAKVAVLIPLIAIGYITSTHFNYNLPWGGNTALVVGVFFYIGYLLKSMKLLTKNAIFNPVCIIFCLIIGVVAFYFNNIVSCIDYNYGNLILTLLSGICLSTVVIYIAYKISENKVLEYIGRNTLGILIFHKLIILVFQTKLGVVSTLLRDSNIVIELILSIVITFISICFSLIATEVIRKILPLSIGETRNNK